MQWMQGGNQKELCIDIRNSLYDSQKHNVEWKKKKRRMHSDFISMHLKQALISGD